MFYVTMTPILCVAAGGAMGSLLRYAASQLVQHFHSGGFPIATMLVNIIGSLVIGVMMARYAIAPSESAQLFFVSGMLGGFTTFSAFSWEALQLLQRGQATSAAIYVMGSVMLSLGAVFLGFRLGQ